MEIHLMKATSAPWLLQFPDFKADNGTAEGLGDSFLKVRMALADIF